MTLDKIYKHPNLTICEVTCDDGTKFRVGVPFESDSEEDLKEYIQANYKTSKEEIDNDEPTEEYLQGEYIRKRLPEYPSIGDQLDALWKGGEAAAEMLARIQSVKTKYPKPE